MVAERVELKGHVVEVGRAKANAHGGEGLAGRVVGVGGDFAVTVGELGDAVVGSDEVKPSQPTLFTTKGPIDDGG